MLSEAWASRCFIMQVVQVSVPDEALDMPLREASRQVLSEALMRTYAGLNAWKPDVTLRLGGKKLPAHRFLLQDASCNSQAIFQVSHRTRMTLLLLSQAFEPSRSHA